MLIIPKGIGRAARAPLLFKIGEEQTFSECALFPRKKGEPPEGATCEGTARTSFLEKRDKYL